MKRLLLLLLPLLPAFVNAEESHDHDHQHHHGDEWEFGASVSSVWLDEKEHDDVAVGIHLHAIRAFEKKWFGHQFGYGAGMEAIFGESEHYTPALSLAYFPTENLSFIISPGIEFAKHSHGNAHEEEEEDQELHSEDDDGYDSSFSVHFEVVYTFEAKDFHYGPVIGYSQNEDGDSHFSVGIHVGF